MDYIEKTRKGLSLDIEENFKEFLCNFYADAISGQIIFLLKYKQPVDREATIRYLTAVSKQGLAAALQA